jgi:16S rRNA (guanine966-N2)-methyltransferase
MRVIAGDLRGRRLAAPVGPGVRPTSDRVREAIFDILYSLGGVEGLQVADLFAGSGALGIEALSRGASSVTFVERDPLSVAAIRKNLESVGLGSAGRGSAGREGTGRDGTTGDGTDRDSDATVVRADVDTWVGTTASRYDLVLCDPPYDYAGWDELVGRLPADLAVLESGVEIAAPVGWGIIKTRRYGGTIVTVARPELATKKGVS